jgi:hypothetical protein
MRLDPACAVPVLLVGGLGASAVSAFADDDVQPAPPSIGADVPLTYFGPPPSSVMPELVGPVQLLKSGTIDFDAGTITLPLYYGTMWDGRSVWYVVTDTSDAANAEALGLNHSGKLLYADTCRGVRTAWLENDANLVFGEGTVDFSPERVLVPGPVDAPFPPVAFEPGAVGDEFYTPLVKILNPVPNVYNAPIVAFDVDESEIDFCDGEVDHSKVHDQVTAICPSERTVTLKLVLGHSFAKPVFYLSLDANDPLPAAIEGVTYAPALRDVDIGRDDSLFSAVERLFLVTNGQTGIDNPQRQGLNSALLGEGSPLNVIGGIPTVALDYSPVWDLNVGEWTQEAVDNGYRSRMTDEFQFLGMVEQGFITGLDGAPFASSGFVVNCPIVHRFL